MLVSSEDNHLDPPRLQHNNIHDMTMHHDTPPLTTIPILREDAPSAFKHILREDGPSAFNPQIIPLPYAISFSNNSRRDLPACPALAVRPMRCT